MLPLPLRVGRLLEQLEGAQSVLLSLFSEKRRRLAAADAGELQRFAVREGEAAQSLQEVIRDRQQLLLAARKEGFPAENLRGLVGLLGPRAADLGARIERAEQVAAQLRRESWSHWITSQRCYTHYTEVLELIAQGGQTNPVYSRRANTQVTGGALLDATI